ncbi:MAG TPA: hypothetical protein ENN25_04830 [Euryarchaeota archaeon]|nr:hypothetical protein [Euryarchaeota archaeon]
MNLPGPTSKRLCPICDSQIEKGDEKCSFCGTDLSIFEEEIEEAFEEEEKLVSETFSKLEEAPSELAAEEKELIADEDSIEEGAELEDLALSEAEESVKEDSGEASFECPACGGAVSDKDDVCPHCGAIFTEDGGEQFECPACGTTVNADAARCPGCGAFFVEEEAAADVTEEEPEINIGPTIVHERPDFAAARTASPSAEDTTLEDAIASAKESKKKPARKPRDAEEKPPAKKKGLMKGLNFFKGLIPGSGEEAKADDAAAPTVESKKAPSIASRKGERKPGRSSEVQRPAAEVKRAIPKDPREQGKELARLVAEVRALLSIAREREIKIDESEKLIDEAIMSGRERQFIQALELVTQSERKLHEQFYNYTTSVLASLKEESDVAVRLGGNPSRAEAFIKEAHRAAEGSDFQAAMVFVDKAKSELKPVTGRYNDTLKVIRRFEKLARDARIIGINKEPSMKKASEARAAFESLEFDKADAIIKDATGDLTSQIPDRINHEIENAKQMLLEVKVKTGKSISPQTTILKSVIWAVKEEKFLDALSEMKHFKREMKELLS